MKEPIICTATPEIVCPHCGAQFHNSLDVGGFGESEGVVECRQCTKPLRWKRTIQVTYDTRPAEQE